MIWNPKQWKFNFKSLRDRWLFLLALGIMLLLLSMPIEGEKKGVKEAVETERSMAEETGAVSVASGKSELSYEQKLENRLKALLQQVEGVGQVDVMIVLKNNGEKVWQSDASLSSSRTEEQDSGGGTRKVENRDEQSAVVLAGEEGPILKKELSPELSGVIVSAEGGGNPSVQAEISQAVEALFGLPAHKVKVLKRTPQ